MTTDTDALPLDPPDIDALPRTTEQWTFGGTTAATGKDARHIWYDADRHCWYFTPVPRTHPVVGCVYDVETTRYRATKDDGTALRVTRYSVPSYVGRQDDTDWAASLEAEDYARRQEVAAGQLERRAARDPELAKALAPIERIAANMPYASRDALVAHVTRMIYRANRSTS